MRNIQHKLELAYNAIRYRRKNKDEDQISFGSAYTVRASERSARIYATQNNHNKQSL